MNTLEIARRMAELEQYEDACRAYTLAIQQGGLTPEEELEAALYILQAEGDYRVAYTCFRSLYDRNLFREECLDIITQAFYRPNVKLQKARYEKNCKALAKYPYLFRKDFLDFEFLPVKFYPFDDSGYLPFHPSEGRFDGYVDFNHTVISRNFFHDLENPILAKDVYSQYELEYLNDNVRPSEWVGRENHIYLHYSDWGEFCAHLQVLNFRELLKDKKLVFLIGDEVKQYPIDFKERFGIDYSQYPVKPVGIREVKKLIWHTQLSAHNGGDFFNEIFDGHPNLIAMPSIMMDRIENTVSTLETALKGFKSVQEAEACVQGMDNGLMRELYFISDRTQKDIFVAVFFNDEAYRQSADPSARIAPALFFQPHFHILNYGLRVDFRDRMTLYSQQLEKIRTSPLFRDFKYIKTFTPMRRPTTSYGASVRFMRNWVGPENSEKVAVVDDHPINCILNRSFMRDPEDRLYKDSVLVRFEDGKLNPRATFTALAAFLDLPYTESMTYCSLLGQRNPESMKGNDIGFSAAAVYRTYDDYANDAERYFLEYFLRDAYEYYGYDFHYYDGAPVDRERIKELVSQFTTINHYIRESWHDNALPEGQFDFSDGVDTPERREIVMQEWLDDFIKRTDENRLHIANYLLETPYFINENGQPLQMMPKLELDPALLEQPLYH